MTKIVQAVNAMLANSNSISNVQAGRDETFFSYKDKYIWSMAKREDTFWLWYYPESPAIEDLLEHSEHQDWNDVPMVSYNDAEIGTREAKSSFRELYATLSEKLYDVDKALDEIIADGDLL